ncbi:hypothetical protein Tco_0843907 [Tanacetum coccineum]
MKTGTRGSVEEASKQEDAAAKEVREDGERLLLLVVQELTYEVERYKEKWSAVVVCCSRSRSSRNPTGGYEGIRRFEDYHGDGNMDGSLAAKEKGRVEHFGITLKEEEEGKHKLMHTSYCQ